MGGDGGVGGDACVGLECQVPTCPPGQHTTISGKVYDPSGTLPLAHVRVFVPKAPPPQLHEGASCERCNVLATSSITHTFTDASGGFVLDAAPAGSQIPLVLQTGKWRRQITIAEVAPCTDTALTDPQLTRLPRNQREGDMPRIAVATGAGDTLECLPRRLGIDDSELTTKAGAGRVHLFAGPLSGSRQGVQAFDTSLNDGALLTPSSELWSSLESLLRYDLVILSCEGQTQEPFKPPLARQLMYDYASQGGRILASHWQNIWFAKGPQPLPNVGTWTDRQDPAEGDGPVMATVNQAFPAGAEFASWLTSVGASAQLGQLEVTASRDNLQAVDPLLAREWLSVDNPNYPEAPKAVQMMSFDAPLGVPEEMQCGRAVYTDLHLASGPFTAQAAIPNYPLGCTSGPLTSQEKTFVFMLFHVGDCLADPLQGGPAPSPPP